MWRDFFKMPVFSLASTQLSVCDVMTVVLFVSVSDLNISIETPLKK